MHVATRHERAIHFSSYTRTCDITLREGIQSGAGIFHNQPTCVEYATAVLDNGFADQLEIYRPGKHMSADAYAALLERHGDSIRVYCGPIHRFTPDDLRRLPSTVRSVAFTLMGPPREAASALDQIDQLRPGTRVRLGLECSGERARTGDLTDDTLTAWRNPGIDCVAICDSNGTMEPLEVQGAVERIAQADPSVKLGFHFHNDRGLAAANTYAALWSCYTNDISSNVDAAVSGVGERNGVTALEDLVALRASNDDLSALREAFARLHGLAGTAEIASFRRTPLGSASGEIAASHYDEQGILRGDYQGLY